MAEYIMITPVKNENPYIRKTIESVINQTVLPKHWVIIDGASTDITRQIITEYANKYPWIHLKHQFQFSKTSRHMNVSFAVAEGYAYAVQYCNDHGIHYDYIWTIDGDQYLDPDTCAGIIRHMEQDKHIGAASGQVYNPRRIPDTYPAGELPNKRVYCRDAIEQIGGFPVTKYSYDTVILAKLHIMGWGIKSYPKYMILNFRIDTGIEKNGWKSHLQFGKARYYLGYSFPLLVMGCGYLAIQRKPIKAIGVFWGYLESWIDRNEVIKDRQVWNHFHYERLWEILK